MTFAQLVVAIGFTYVTVGLAFALAFVWIGVVRVDPAAHRASLGFRVLILPGSMALWPWLAVRWIKALQRGGRA